MELKDKDQINIMGYKGVFLGKDAPLSDNPLTKRELEEHLKLLKDKEADAFATGYIRGLAAGSNKPLLVERLREIHNATLEYLAKKDS